MITNFVRYRDLRLAGYYWLIDHCKNPKIRPVKVTFGGNGKQIQVHLCNHPGTINPKDLRGDARFSPIDVPDKKMYARMFNQGPDGETADAEDLKSSSI